MTHKTFRLVRSLFLALAVLGSTLNPQPVRAAGPWYVTPTGDDNNDCLSASTPCATINSAIGKASAGDTIYVAIGTYTGSGSSVVSLYNDLTLSGGWNSDFATQNSLSIIDGQNVRTGISSGIGVIDHFKIMNGYSFNGAGGIESYGSLILNNSIVINNRTDGGSTGSAGGIFSAGDLTLNNSTVQGNISRGRAGGILLYVNNALTLNNSTITWNQAADSGGGIVFSGGSGGGPVPVANILNSTISNNSAQFGGGMKIEGWSPSRTVNISNSIIANNTGITEGPDCWGEINTLDHSIIGDTSNCTVPSGTGNLVNLNPLLSTYPVGLVAYHTLLTGSPAIDAGNNATCLDVDQRGVTRPQGAACDMGAYEYTTSGTAASLLVAGGSNQLTGTTLAFPKPLQAAVLDSQGSPVSGVTVEFAAPGSGASGIFADTNTNTTTVNTDAGGVATTSVFTANDQAGAYTVSASATGLGSVNFSLEQVVRPVNDNFANTEAIASLPFSDSLDNTQATAESGEPQYCYYLPKTVWYSFTPTANVVLTADMAGSSFNDTILNIYQDGGSGIGGLSFITCAYYGNTATLHFQAGVTYYFQAGSIDSGGGDLHLNLQQVPPPVNDNFSGATTIGGLPFSDSVNNTGATTESGEPQNCSNSPNTVWYAFTAITDGVIRADMMGSSFSDTNLSVYRAGGPGIGDLSFLQCSSYDYSVTFSAQAGVTYYFQAGSINSGGGDLHLNLQAPLPPANDRFDSATVIRLSLPFDDTVDTSAASIEEGEPTPSCAFDGLGTRSVWYAFTPKKTGSVSTSILSAAFTSVMAVYTGNSAGDLTQVGCQVSGEVLTFRSKAGTTYYFQVNNLYPSEQGGSMQFHLEVTPPPVADFYFYPVAPTIFDTVQFYDNFYDPAQAGIQSFVWNFGDGSRSTDANPTHQYAKDGNYTVRYTVTTVDGRKASISKAVHVKTNQVIIDIKPGQKINRLVIGSGADPTVLVAILSTKNFNAPRQVDKDSLTFGHTGDEDSLNRTGSNLTPNCQARDVNRDGRLDLVCRFMIERTGFQLGDKVGILKGMTARGVQIQGRDSVVIRIQSYP